MTKPLMNAAAERAVLSGVCSYGAESYLEIEDLIETETFVLEENQIIFKCLEKVLSTQDEVDIASILSAANELSLGDTLNNKKSMDHLRAVYNFPIKLQNVKQHAIKIRKLQIGRVIRAKAASIHNEISKINGDETVSEIIGVAENPIFELSSSLGSNESVRPTFLGENVEEYLLHLEENPSSIMGIPSGYPRYDAAIGGGFRRKCVDLVAARPKVGKSMFGDNVGLHIAGELDIPVLMLDTEMSLEDHLNRVLANLSGVEINEISTGKYSQDATKKERVYAAAEHLKGIPYKYVSIAGSPFEQTLSIMRRWILQEVGFDENGRTNNCLIIYDYLKLMSADSLSNIQEFQALGFQITSLHNFCVEYDCPCLSFVQLNRDGITRESTDVVSGSDRLIWLCTSFSIFKNKSDEEIAEDGPEAGNKKLIPIVARHGPALEDGDYINMSMSGSIAQIVENITRNELKKGGSKQKDDGFIVNEDDDDNEEIPFETAD